LGREFYWEYGLRYLNFGWVSRKKWREVSTIIKSDWITDDDDIMPNLRLVKNSLRVD
jgi:hypothetical protein